MQDHCRSKTFCKKKLLLAWIQDALSRRVQSNSSISVAPVAARLINLQQKSLAAEIAAPDRAAAGNDDDSSGGDGTDGAGSAGEENPDQPLSTTSWLRTSTNLSPSCGAKCASLNFLSTRAADSSWRGQQ
jgi:hypothetical protein